MSEVVEHQNRVWPGVFITFEGGDGVGKSTHVKLLVERLRGEGFEVIQTREPGGSEGAEEIRALLVSGEPGKWSAMTEALLMIAARVDHLEKIILPALRRGAIVISDRFIDSTVAYQGIAGELGIEGVNRLHDIALGDVKPDLTYILTLPSDTGLARTEARVSAVSEDRFEQKGSNFQAQVHQAFKQIARSNQDRCICIDTKDEVSIVKQNIYSSLRDRFDLRNIKQNG